MQLRHDASVPVEHGQASRTSILARRNVWYAVIVLVRNHGLFSDSLSFSLVSLAFLTSTWVLALSSFALALSLSSVLIVAARESSFTSKSFFSCDFARLAFSFVSNSVSQLAFESTLRYAVLENLVLTWEWEAR